MILANSITLTPGTVSVDMQEPLHPRAFVDGRGGRGCVGRHGSSSQPIGGAGVMYELVLLAVVITMSFPALYRASRGPTVFTVLAVNMFGTKTVLLICIVSFMIGRVDFLDLALLYSLMNFIGMVAVLRFSKYGTFADDRSVAEEATS